MNHIKNHNLFLESLKIEIQKNVPGLFFETNCKYDPISRNIFTIKSKQKYFEYDMIGFPKNLSNIDYRHPQFFIEFTNNRYWETKKFVYETWRWIWFLFQLKLIRAMPPFEDLIEPQKPQIDCNGNIWKPTFIQIWRAKTTMKHFNVLTNIGLVPKFLNINVCEINQKFNTAGKLIDIAPIYKNVYSNIP